MLKYILSLIAKPKPKILSVHSMDPASLRIDFAGKLFIEEMQRAKKPAIVCGPKTALLIAKAMGVAVPEKARYWNKDRAMKYAKEAISDLHPSVTVSEEGVACDLLWLSEDGPIETKPARVTVFSGSTQQDPFVDFERTSHFITQTAAHIWATEANQYFSGWRKND